MAQMVAGVPASGRRGPSRACFTCLRQCRIIPRYCALAHGAPVCLESVGGEIAAPSIPLIES